MTELGHGPAVYTRLPGNAIVVFALTAKHQSKPFIKLRGQLPTSALFVAAAFVRITASGKAFGPLNFGEQRNTKQLTKNKPFMKVHEAFVVLWSQEQLLK